MAKKTVKKAAKKTAKLQPSALEQDACNAMTESTGEETDYQRGFRHGKNRAESENPLISARNLLRSLRHQEREYVFIVRDLKLNLDQAENELARIRLNLSRVSDTINHELYEG
jgi:hypothetical protein